MLSQRFLAVGTCTYLHRRLRFLPKDVTTQSAAREPRLLRKDFHGNIR